MDTKNIALTAIAESEDNPRVIATSQLQALVKSILALPKMLNMRPLVIDGNHIIGGNMRHRALSIIAEMTEEDIHDAVNDIAHLKKLTSSERDEIVKYWVAWTKSPVVSVCDATDLTPEEKKSFVIKDNVSYGEWDYGKLEKFDSTMIGELGIDTWSCPTTIDIPDEPVTIASEEDKRILIVYRREDIESVAELLKLSEICKPAYKFAELDSLNK